jgi:hypothetical protein
LPSDFALLDSPPRITSSSTFIDMPGVVNTLTIDSTSKIYANMTFETQSYGVGDYATGAYRVVIHDSSSVELKKYLYGTDEVSIGSVEHLAGPYDPGTYTVKGQYRRVSGTQLLQLNQVELFSEGLRGAKRDSGFSGFSGYSGVGLSGWSGWSGYSGSVGSSGYSGTSVSGYSGSSGVSGYSGLDGATAHSGYSGAQGSSGYSGVGGSGYSGTIGASGYSGVSGYSGIVGYSGYSGFSGISQNSESYNTVSRYSIIDTSGSEVWCVSSSTSYQNFYWTRSTTTLTINRDSHGHTAGDRVIIRNTNMDYQACLIATVSTNSFTVTTTDTGDPSGTAGAYSLGFTYVQTSSGGTLSSPTGDHADVQLLSLRIRTGTRAGTTYDLALPTSAVNGTGADSSLADCYIPDYLVRNDSDTLTAIAGTMTVNNSAAGYNVFRFGNLGSTASRFILLHF